VKLFSPGLTLPILFKFLAGERISKEFVEKKIFYSFVFYALITVWGLFNFPAFAL